MPQDAKKLQRSGQSLGAGSKAPSRQASDTRAMHRGRLQPRALRGLILQLSSEVGLSTSMHQGCHLQGQNMQAIKRSV